MLRLSWSNNCSTLPVFLGVTNSANIFDERVVAASYQIPVAKTSALPSFASPYYLVQTIMLCYAMLCQQLLIGLNPLSPPKIVNFLLTVSGNREVKVQEVSGHKPVLGGGQRGGRWWQRVEAGHRLVDDGSW